MIFVKGDTRLAGNSQSQALHGHGHQLHADVDEYAQGDQHHTDGQHDQFAGVGGNRKIADDQRSQIQEIPEHSREQDLHQADQPELSAQDEYLKQDIDAVNGDDASTQGEVGDQTDHIWEGTDGGYS